MPLVFSTSLVDTLWVYNCLGGTFEGLFLDQVGLPLGHSFDYLSFLHAFIPFGWQSVVVRDEFVHAIEARGFPVWYFLSVAVSTSRCISTLGLSSSIQNSVCTLIIHSTFFMIFPCTYFAPKSFCLVRIRLLLCLRPSPPPLVGRIFSLFWKVLFCPYYLVLYRYLFLLPSFASSFWLNSSSCILRSSCRAFAPSSEYIFFLCFIAFACCRSFLNCDSNLCSHPGFDFLSMVFRGTPIFHTYQIV